jgi:hypothetical protein
MTTQQNQITGCKKSENRFAQHYSLMYAIFVNDDNDYLIIRSQLPPRQPHQHCNIVAPSSPPE